MPLKTNSIIVHVLFVRTRDDRSDAFARLWSSSSSCPADTGGENARAAETLGDQIRRERNQQRHHDAGGGIVFFGELQKAR